MTTSLIEKVARAIYENAKDVQGDQNEVSWEYRRVVTLDGGFDLEEFARAAIQVVLREMMEWKGQNGLADLQPHISPWDTYRLQLFLQRLARDGSAIRVDEGLTEPCCSDGLSHAGAPWQPCSAVRTPEPCSLSGPQFPHGTRLVRSLSRQAHGCAGPRFMTLQS